MQNIPSYLTDGQDTLCDACQEMDEIGGALWLFEHGAPVPGVSANVMRRHEMGNTATGQRAQLFLTLLRAIESDDPVGVHVAIPSQDAPLHCFFVGATTNTFAETPGGGLSFFIEPDTDLSFALIDRPSFVRKDFATGHCPPLVPHLTTVWTRRPRGAPLSCGTISAWPLKGERHAA